MKLTEEKIAAIVRMRIAGKTFKAIGKAFRIDPSYAHRLYAGGGRGVHIIEPLRRKALERRLKKLEDKAAKLKEELSRITPPGVPANGQ